MNDPRKKKLYVVMDVLSVFVGEYDITGYVSTYLCPGALTGASEGVVFLARGTRHIIAMHNYQRLLASYYDFEMHFKFDVRASERQ